MNSKIQLAVLKAASNKLFTLLRCVRDHPFDRDGLREAVLRLYPGRDEKSVFRGMVIPTLRRLGLIVGYEESIRLSTSGVLIVTALDKSETEGLRALRAILLEKDQASAGFISELELAGPMAIEQFLEMQSDKIDAPNKKQFLERVRDWIAYLSYSGLMTLRDKTVQVNSERLRQAQADLDITSKRRSFKRLLFTASSELIQHQSGVRSVDMDEVRERVATLAYKEESFIITKDQFDTLLREIPHITEDYAITFGRSMGPEENLFVLDGRYYQTISIRFEKEH